MSLIIVNSCPGYDTASRSYGIGKTSVLYMYTTLKGYSDIFLLPNKQYTEVDPAGHHTMGIIYGCLPGSVSVLNFERATRFNEKVFIKSSYIPPERLPHTSGADTFHS